MLTFKEYLSEAKSRTKVMNSHDVIEWMEKNARAYLKNGHFLYRGVAGGGKGGVTFGDASVGEPRKSLNTYNNYTLWIDNHPMFHSKPRRGNAFITTTNQSQAGNYGPIYLVIPDDSAKVGSVGKNDMWDVQLAGSHYSILAFNEDTTDAFDAFNIDNPKSFKEFKHAAKEVTLDKIESGDTNIEDDTSLGKLMRMYGAKDLYALWAELVTPDLFKYMKGANITGKGEFWIDGPAVFIPLDSDDLNESDAFAILSWAQDTQPKLAKVLEEYWETPNRIDPDTVSDEDTLTYSKKKR